MTTSRELEHIAEDAAREAGGEYRPAYNGWPNRETWHASLWINNNEYLADRAREIVREALEMPDQYPDWPAADNRALKISHAADGLREEYDDFSTAADSPDAELPGPVADAWNYALACVDWRRIAEGMAEGIELPA